MSLNRNGYTRRLPRVELGASAPFRLQCRGASDRDIGRRRCSAAPVNFIPTNDDINKVVIEMYFIHQRLFSVQLPRTSQS